MGAIAGHHLCLLNAAHCNRSRFLLEDPARFSESLNDNSAVRRPLTFTICGLPPGIDFDPPGCRLRAHPTARNRYGTGGRRPRPSSAPRPRRASAPPVFTRRRASRRRPLAPLLRRSDVRAGGCLLPRLPLAEVHRARLDGSFMPATICALQLNSRGSSPCSRREPFR